MVLKMLRFIPIALVCFMLTSGWAVPLRNLLEENPEMNPDLFEGDILGINVTAFRVGDEPKNAVRDPYLLWPEGVIYYIVANDFSDDELNVIWDAMDQYEARTCLRFVERWDEANYIYIRKSGTGCNSYIGMIGGEQLVSLDTGCFACNSDGVCVKGVVIHEFMHAAGFYHEQSRTDRDRFITINYDNILPGYESAFAKYGQDVIQYLGARYDYGSVMHYERYAFAKDPSIPTIYPRVNVEIGQRRGFSETDVYKLNTLYGCYADGVVKDNPRYPGKQARKHPKEKRQ